MNFILSLIKNLRKYLISVKFATIVLSFLLFYTLATALFPQNEINISKNVFPFDFINYKIVNSINFQNNFRTIIFTSLIVLVTISLLFSLYYRTKSEIKKIKNIFSSKYHNFDPEFILSAFQLIRKLRYHVSILRDGTVYRILAVKGIYGVLGSIIFHASLILILFGIFISTYSFFDGTFALVEGQKFNSIKSKYLNLDKGKILSCNQTEIEFRLQKVYPDYEINKAKTDLSEIELPDGTLKKIFVNNSYYVAGYRIHQGSKNGYAPYIMIKNEDNQFLYEAFTRLAVSKSSNGYSHYDFLELENGIVRIEFRFLPAAKMINGKYISISNEPVKPLIHVIVYNGGLKDETYIPIGQIADVGKYKIGFLDLRRWSEFTISKDNGFPIILFGAFFSIIGIVVRFLNVKKEIIINIYQTDWRYTYDIYGKTEKFVSNFDQKLNELRMEFDKLIRKFSSGEKMRISI